MKLHVRKEADEGERRVAATPETVEKLVKMGFSVSVERGAGEQAHFPDAGYEAAGAVVVDAPPPSEIDVLVTVGPPTEREARGLREGAAVVGFLAPHAHPELVKALRDRRVSALALELVPRISRAQSMDALSSQASIAGYRAVLLAAMHLDKYMPLMMTAAGTITPARFVVMGAGVAGLSAIATARRLGAIVEVSDIRPEVKEQVESLGGRFIELEDLESGTGEGGYAREVSEEFLRRQQAIVRERVVAADAVVTTALVPGRPAPKLVTEDMLREMRTGSVVVDLAVEQGGNCELSVPGETVVRHGVTLVGEKNLPATLPSDASRTYARNVLALLEHLVEEGRLVFDLEDEITRGTLLTHEGEVLHGPTAELLREREVA